MTEVKEVAVKKQGSEVLQLVSFSVGQEEFGVDILKVQEIIKMMDITRVPRTPDFVRGVINLRGKVIPVVDITDTSVRPCGVIRWVSHTISAAPLPLKPIRSMPSWPSTVSLPSPGSQMKVSSPVPPSSSCSGRPVSLPWRSHQARSRPALANRSLL